MSRLISIDGLDGSGKGTQSELLAEALSAAGKTAKVLSFPMYDCDSSFAVRMYLDGALGGSPSDTNAYAASSFFAVDRYISFRTLWGADIEKYDYIIFNRYVSANAVHQLSKLPREAWDGFLAWLWDFEFDKLGLPRPDLTLYLVVEPEISASLVERRGAKKDIHEKDGAYMERCYRAGLYAAERLGFHKIGCCASGAIRAREDIAAEILAEVLAL